MHRTGGTAADGEGEPLRDVWVTLPDAGKWVATDRDGRFLFDRLPPGRHRLLARTADGRETDGHLDVPGAWVDLVFEDGKTGGRKAAKKA